MERQCDWKHLVWFDKVYEMNSHVSDYQISDMNKSEKVYIT